MSVSLRNVLISDAVDSACVELLESHGIKVTCKYKLPKDQLLQEIKVSTADNYQLLLVEATLPSSLTLHLKDAWGCGTLASHVLTN
jgi:hypothetical protein